MKACERRIPLKRSKLYLRLRAELTEIKKIM